MVHLKNKNMKLFSFYFSILYIVFSICAESVSATTIPDSTRIYGIWNIAGSPYVIMGLAIIPADSTLTIEPGVRVEFKSSTIDSAFLFPYLDVGWIKAHGRMIALGSETDSIIFTSLGEGNWGGIHFENISENIHLKYCKIDKCETIKDEMMMPGYEGEVHEGGLTFKNARAVIGNCDLSNNCFGLFAMNSEIILTHSRINHNIIGAQYFKSSGKVSSSLFSDNYECGISSQTSSVVIENNLMEEQLQGIYSYESYDRIIGNVMRNNLWCGIHITDGNPFVFRNIIYGSNSGLRCNGSPKIINNTIINNRYFGIYCDYHAKPILINNIIFGNTNLIRYDAESSAIFTNCLLQGDTLPTGLTDAGGNIFSKDPLLLDPDNEDFSLNAGSPCINAGLSYFEWDGLVLLDLSSDQYIGYAPDIGAIESTVLGINDKFPPRDFKNKISAYPNPSSGNTIRIYHQKAESGNTELVITNSMGSLIHQQIVNSDVSEINISNWPSGIYFAVIYEEGKATGQTKIIVQ